MIEVDTKCLWQTLRCVNVGVVSQVFASGQAIREASLSVLRPTVHGSETSRTSLYISQQKAMLAAA